MYFGPLKKRPNKCNFNLFQLMYVISAINAINCCQAFLFTLIHFSVYRLFFSGTTLSLPVDTWPLHTTSCSMLLIFLPSFIISLCLPGLKLLPETKSALLLRACFRGQSPCRPARSPKRAPLSWVWSCRIRWITAACHVQHLVTGT